ncbi:response regulator transcription factor [Ruegeria sp. 2205SS24-7]|uniref:response regulator transcription factor n=1 Tax=Ruegeria discodermiae TaxID=3064389 RepID=UPI0027410215|nr:response regulator transcription factor [Ruegeria sp. 2205SS24-7]MDP5220201.1 response regulator transcription factor [Ruegeria sp. 2205SS24-7]
MTTEILSARQSNTCKSKVLCIEDDPIVQLMLRDIVGTADAECCIVSSARDAEDQLANEQFDLVLLDRRLPDSDGLLLLQTIKQANDCPVMILSAMDETRDKLLGLGLGAEEYITKPFNPLELCSRIRQLLGATANMSSSPGHERFETAGMTFDPRSRRLEADGSAAILAPAEARLLHTLLLNAGEVRTRDELSQFVCAREWSPGDRTIDVLINRLRRYIKGLPAEITTVHRTGYMLSIENEAKGAKGP